MTRRVLTSLTVFVLSGLAVAYAQQAPPPAQPPTPRPAAPRPARPAAPDARTTMTVLVTDASGAGQAGVRVMVSGPVTRSGETSDDGSVRFQGMRAGTYRLRFEADAFITLEREVVLKPGVLPPVDVALNRARAKPAAPPEPPRPAPSAQTVPPADPNALAEAISVVQFFAKNRLERGEPRRESQVLRSALAAASLLQVRDALVDRTHAEADEVLYVINGSAWMNSKGRQQALETGALLIIPRGVHYTIENRGKEPIWILSVLSPPGGAKP